MTKSPCILCNHESFSVSLTSYPWGYPDEPRLYERCNNCGLIREDPLAYQTVEFDIHENPESMSPEERRQFQYKYGEAMDVIDDTGELYALYEYDDPAQMSNDLLDRIIRRNTVANAPSVLEIGCADGFLLRELKKVIPDLIGLGIDPSPVSYKRAKKLGTNTLLGTLQDIDSQTHDIPKVDIAYAFGNLMLHPDPLDTLIKMRSTLKPDGKIIVDVKNINSLPRKLALITARTPLRSLPPIRKFITRNFTNMRYSFSKEQVCKMAELAGLKVVELNTLPPRALAYSNSHKGSNGIIGIVWHIFDWIDSLRDERAWVELVATKA